MTSFRLVARLQERLEKRRRYNRLVDEIMGMSPRDLADIRGDRAEMLRDVHRTIYG